MKLKYFIAASIFFMTVISAQNIEAPKEVKNAFSKKYPNISDVKWSKENSEAFEAEFRLNGVKTSVVIDKDGEIEETETAITIQNLPKNVIPFININYAGYKITETAKIIDENGNVYFEAEVSKGKTRKDLLFDDNGKLVKKEKEYENENNEDEEED